MSTFEFRKLKADEIECRVQSSTDRGAILLIYKTARVDYAMLDEIVGANNWQIEYKEIKGNMYCGISIYDDVKKQWITKWNCGSEARTEAEKSEASDACKRAGFAWGIGRELYSAPFIWISLNPDEIDKGKIKPNIKFEVSEIAYDDKRNISKLVIKDNKGAVRFTYPSKVGKNSTVLKQDPKPTNAIPSKVQEQSLQKSTILTREELDLIKKDEFLTSKMLEACGSFKWKDLSEEYKTTVTTFMRQLIERGI
ncbi:MAG TPA: Rad52/Rad22 family DNA repair protein [Candidatus Pelethenecus sp.]|nr:Rad52/Rad22 family DNA repair protein [Candidatus Pelethenecus sp.]